MPHDAINIHKKPNQMPIMGSS